MTIDEMAEDESQWPTIRELILSGQVPASRIAKLMREYPKLAAWLTLLTRSTQIT